MRRSLSFLSRVRLTIRKHHMLSGGEKIVVGVSGGPDSMALLHALMELRDEFGISLCVAHLNHGFRAGESDREQEFVQKVGEALHLPCFSEKQDVAAHGERHGLSKQTAAREVRYRFFEKVAAESGAHRIALAHTADDQAETVLMRVLRGAGTKGLAGIPPVRDEKIIRPLLETRKHEIFTFLKEKGIEYVEDSSNSERKYTRNRVRLNLIPHLIKEYNPNLIETLNTVSDICRGDEEYLMEITAGELEALTVNRGPGFLELDLAPFTRRHYALKRRVLREALKKIKGDGTMIGFYHIEEGIRLADTGDSGSRLHLPAGVSLQKGYDTLKITRTIPRATPDYEQKVNVPGETVIDEAGLKIQSEIVDLRQSGGELPISESTALFDMKTGSRGLCIRNRRNGDIFHPRGMKGSKKIKKFFIDAKVPREERDAVPLLVSGEDILWVIGFRRSCLSEVNDSTEKAIRVTVY